MSGDLSSSTVKGPSRPSSVTGDTQLFSLSSYGLRPDSHLLPHLRAVGAGSGSGSRWEWEWEWGWNCRVKTKSIIYVHYVAGSGTPNSCTECMGSGNGPIVRWYRTVPTSLHPNDPDPSV